MSDGRIIDNVDGERNLCEDCGCISIVFNPQDWLEEYYRTTYDISDKVQSPPVVVENKTLLKHDLVFNSLFSYTKEKLQGTKQGSFLEIACANGKLTELFAREFPSWHCIGIDPSTSAGNLIQSPNASFISGYFDPDHFRDQKFDCITSHGFPHLSGFPGLKAIRSLSRPGTILSIEFLALENSEFTPFTWDHPRTFSKQAMEAYIMAAGYTVKEKSDCVTAQHFICECTHEATECLELNKSIIADTKRVFNSHLQWWEKIIQCFKSDIETYKNRQIALFGGGIYSAVLLRHLGFEKIDLVIDETKAGTIFSENLPIVSLDDAAKMDDIVVLLCCRPAYAETIVEKLSKAGINDIVIPETYGIKRGQGMSDRNRVE